MKRILTAAITVLSLIFVLVGCATDADVASHNISKAAEQFEIDRRIVFYNGITDEYILSIEGRCSVEFYPLKFTVTCRTSSNEYKKHYLGRADNVFPFIEQLGTAKINVYHYKVIFKPASIIPDIDLKIQGD